MHWCCASIADQISGQQRYLDSLQITLQRARALYQNGAVSYIEVLDAERSYSLHGNRCSILITPNRLMKLSCLLP
jgi:hypothetical protein